MKHLEVGNSCEIFILTILFQCLKIWGYRRCEDICWIKTNIQNPGHNKNLEPNSILQRTKVIVSQEVIHKLS